MAVGALSPMFGAAGTKFLALNQRLHSTAPIASVQATCNVHIVSHCSARPAMAAIQSKRLIYNSSAMTLFCAGIVALKNLFMYPPRLFRWHRWSAILIPSRATTAHTSGADWLVPHALASIVTFDMLDKYRYARVYMYI